jgi:PAS domain S-box-containing protein
VIADKDLTITAVNTAALTMFGYQRQELLGKNVKELIPKTSEHYRNHDVYFANYKNSGRRRLMNSARVLPAAKKDGSVFMVELHLSKAKIANDPSAMYYAVLREAAGLTSSFENLSMPIIVMDNTCVVTTLNKSAMELFELDNRLDMVGQPITAFLDTPLHANADAYGHPDFAHLFEDPLSKMTPPKLSTGGQLLAFLPKNKASVLMCEATLSEDRGSLTSSRYFLSLRDVSLARAGSPGSNSSAGFNNMFEVNSSTPTSKGGEHMSREEGFRSGPVGPSSLAGLPTDVAALQKQVVMLMRTLQDEQVARRKLGEELATSKKKISDLNLQIAELSQSSAAANSKASALPPGTPVVGAGAAGPHARFISINVKDLKVKEKIGSGGFAKVYRAVWLGKEVAVKKLRQDINKDIAASFLAEMALLSSLRHPNVVLMMGACHTPKGDAIVTEFLRGGSLYHYLERLAEQGRLMNYTLMRAFALDIAYGMAYLHSMDPPIIHRDLKSLNVLLDENDHCKIADFGLSRELHSSNMASGTMGTPHWLAPEVLKGERYTAKVDVYSYAIVLWEMATTEKPFAGVNPFTLVSRIVNEENFRLALPDWLRPEWVSLIQSCWAPSPASRPSFAEIIEIIQTKIPETIDV